MTIFLIMLLTSIAMSSEIRAIVSNSDDSLPIHFITIFIVFIIGVACIIIENQKETTIESKTLLKPKMEIKIVKNDSIVTSYDTTYIYTFKK